MTPPAGFATPASGAMGATGGMTGGIGANMSQAPAMSPMAADAGPAAAAPWYQQAAQGINAGLGNAGQGNPYAGNPYLQLLGNLSQRDQGQQGQQQAGTNWMQSPNWMTPPSMTPYNLQG